MSTCVSVGRFLDRVHRTLGSVGGVARLTVKVRNQMNAIIGAYLGENGNVNASGELAVVRHLGPVCRTFVDVGANVGEWSACFLAESLATGVAYEPSLQAFAVLRSALDVSRVSCRNVALGDAKGRMPFIEEDNCGKTSSLASIHAPSSLNPREVEVSTLDDEFVGPDDEPIDFLKIDAEGYDLKVLRGARRLLSAGRIRFIQFEYNQNWLAAGSSLREATNYLESMGYHLYLVRTTGLHPFDYDYWGDYFRFSNFFACRRDDRGQIALMIREKI